MPGWQDFDATGAAQEGFYSAQTVLSDIASKRLDVDKKQLDLKISQDSFARQTELTNQLAELAKHPAQGATESERVTSRMMEGADAAMQTGNPEVAAVLARTASGIDQNETYRESIKLQQHQQTFKDMITGLGTVHDEASWQEFVKTFPKSHPPEGEFGTVGILTNADGKPYPYDPARVEALRNSGMTGLQRTQEDLAKAKIKSQGIEDKYKQSQIDVAHARVGEINARKEKLQKAGGGNLVPKADEIKLIVDMAVEDGADPDDKQAMAAVRTNAEMVAEEIPLLMQRGYSKSAAAAKAYKDAQADHVFGGLVPPKGQIPGTKSKPRPLPLNDKGKPDLKKLKANTYVSPTTGKFAGKTLYFDGTAFTEADEDDGEGDGSDD